VGNVTFRLVLHRTKRRHPEAKQEIEETHEPEKAHYPEDKTVNSLF